MIKFNKGDKFMGRPIGTKNLIRTPEEKEKMILEYRNSKISQKLIANKYGLSRKLFQVWIKKYEEKGIEGLRSNTGKHPNPKLGKYNRYPTEEEKLKQEVMKLEIEVARLKKGYQVKGVGAKKEYITTFKKNMK